MIMMQMRNDPHQVEDDIPAAFVYQENVDDYDWN